VDQLECRDLPSTVTWINPTGGYWSVGSNWSSGSTPAPGDDVIINQPGNITITHTQNVLDTINSLTLSDTLTLSGGSLNATTIQNSGTLVVGSGTSVGVGSYVQSGGQTLLQGGTIGALRPPDNTALSFSGTSQVQVPNSASLNPTTQVTVEAWINTNSASTTLQGIAGTWNDLTGNDRTYLLWIQSGKVAFYVSHTGMDFPSVVSTTTIQPNQWYHVAGTFDGTTLRLYVNGVEEASLYSPGPIATNTDPFNIGRVDGGGSIARFFSGQISNVGVFNVARTEAQIQSDMRQELTGSEAGLVGYWTLSSTGSGIVDKTANGNNGTASNPPPVAAPVTGGTVNIEGGTLSGTGTINADLVNAGAVDLGSAAGVLTVNGNYTQTSGGALALKVGGVTAGTQFDQLDVRDAASLNGTLTVSLSGGFNPLAGQVFDSLNFGLESGGFATTNLPTSDGVIDFTTQVTPTSLELVVSFGVDAFIQITPLSAFNEVNHEETFTITVTALPDSTQLNPAAVTFSTPAITYPGLTPGLEAPASATFVSRSGNVATYSLKINSATTGTFEVKASDDITFSSPAYPSPFNTLTLTRTTGDGYTVPGNPSPGGDSPNAFTTYVDAFIKIGPNGDNTINDPHTFVVQVFADNGDGTGFHQVQDSEPVTETLTASNGAGITQINPGSGTGLSSATYNLTTTTAFSPGVIFTSPTAGTVTGHAATDIVVDGVALHRETNGAGNNSSDAVTTFVAPDLLVTKTADAGSITAGGAAGFLITITNPGLGQARSVSLTDPLPLGSATPHDLGWMIDTSGTGRGAGTNPGDFQITGAAGTQQNLVLSPFFLNTLGDVLNGGQSISVHLTSPTTTADAGGSATPVSNASNFSGTAIQFGPAPGGSYVWYTSHFAAQGLPTSGTVHFHATNQSIDFKYTDPVTRQAITDHLAVPDADITYTDTVSVASTTFSGGHWVTTVPLHYNGNVFFSGLAFNVPANGLPGGINPVTWTGTFTVDETLSKAPTLQWQWAAAAYTQFPAPNPDISALYNALKVKPVDDNKISAYQNSDQAGTPEGTIGTAPVKNFVTGGARGGGGSNFTGGNSGTVAVTPSKSGGVLVNTATVTAGNVTFDNDDAASATITITLHQWAATASAQLPAGNLLGSLKPGVYRVAVDNLPAGAAEQARISDAIATIDAELGAFGVFMEQVSAADTASANVHIHFADNSVARGVADGTLGVMTGGDITLIDGWKYYLGSDPLGIGADQYDFQTLVTHELAHAVGLGEGSDASSVLYPYLGTGAVRRELTMADFAALGLPAPEAPAPARSEAAPVGPADPTAELGTAPAPRVAKAAAPEETPSLLSEPSAAEDLAAQGMPGTGVITAGPAQGQQVNPGNAVQAAISTVPALPWHGADLPGVLDTLPDEEADPALGDGRGNRLLSRFGGDRGAGLVPAYATPEVVLAPAASRPDDWFFAAPATGEDTASRSDEPFLAVPGPATCGGERLVATLPDQGWDGGVSYTALAPALAGLALAGWSGPGRDESRGLMSRPTRPPCR
jgi:hypothetical protein